MTERFRVPGWWLASDGKWYPPDQPIRVAKGWVQNANGGWTPPSGEPTPSPGWWRAEDGSWNPPTRHPQPAESPSRPTPQGTAWPLPAAATGATSVPTRRRNVLIGVAAGAVLLVAIAASVGAIHGRRGPFHAAAKQALPVVTTTTDPTVGTAACTTVLPVATAMQLTGAANMQVVSFNQSWTHFPANPNADCHYNASAPRDAFPDASKSVVLWLWINQAHASQIYSDLVAGWPYAGYVPTATPISGIGLRAANNHGALIVQANINDVFYLAVGTGSGVPISEAETIVAELTPPPAPPAPSSSTTGTTHPSTGTSKKTTTTPPATAVRAATARPPSTTTSPTSGTTTSGTTTTAPPSTTTAPPTTTSGPTTTTSVPPPTTTTAPPTTTTTAPLPPVITDPTLPPLPPPVGIPIADPPAGHGGGHGHGDGGGGGNGHGHGGGGGDGHVSEQ